MEIPSGAREGTVAGAGVELRYLEWGEAKNPALVLLHGFMSHAHTWDTFSGAAAARFHVIALDQRGHGNSGWPHEPDYAPEHYAADLEAVIEALRLAPVVLVGHSMGGRSAAISAAAHPERVGKLVIVDTPPEPPPLLRQMRAEALKNPPPENPRHPQFTTVEEVVKSAMAEYPLTPEPLLRHATRHNLKQLPSGTYTWKHDPRLFNSFLRAKPFDLYGELAKLRCPTLLVRGSESPMLSEDLARKMVSRIPRCTYAVIQGAAHDVCMCQPDAFNREVLKFLAG